MKTMLEHLRGQLQLADHLIKCESEGADKFCRRKILRTIL